jgi:HlyD family secretion protein
MLEGTTVEELDQARRALVAPKASLEESRLHRWRLDLRAPVAGRVDALPLELGERPRPGTPLAVLLVDRAPYARVYVP